MYRNDDREEDLQSGDVTLLARQMQRYRHSKSLTLPQLWNIWCVVEARRANPRR